MSKPIHILIVDDEESMRVTLEDILAEKGYVIFTAENGEQALELLKSESIHFFLMDFKMSGMNGLETFKEIRKIDPSSQTLFITAHYDESRLYAGSVDGIVGVCHKPLKIPEVIGYIEGAINT